MEKTKPNILFLISDHHAYCGHFDFANLKFGMPYTESLARDGIFFRNAYSVCPLCTPARSSMMSGVYPSRHGLLWNTECGRPGNQTDFAADQRLYSDYLAEAGYRNGYVGKWHCGATRLPEGFGMEGWSLPHYGKVYMSDRYKEYCRARGLGDATALIERSVHRPQWEGTEQVLHHESPWHFMDTSGILRGPKEGHEENFVSNLAIEKLNEFAESDQPFSLTVSHWGPHNAYLPTGEYAGRINPSDIDELPTFRDTFEGKPHRHIVHRDQKQAGKNRWQGDWSAWQGILARCYEQILQLDDAIKDVVETLKELGLYDNTIIVYCADHGDSVASRGGLWDKASTFTEEVARIPLLVHYPKRIKEGVISGHPVSNMDVTATMLDAAGVEVPEHFDSRSLLELADNVDWREALICEHNGHDLDIFQRIVIKGDYKYVAAVCDGDELYDLMNDPNEFINLVDSEEHAAAKRELQDILVTHMEAEQQRQDGRKLLERVRAGPQGAAMQ